ncbi:MAG: hypothetical protein PHP89_02075 [Candidatus Omnitrophica bacterium]|jgi:2-oxoglutarate dehydrogenase E2 component (dihydrolipoamide succinyltransferase)|nr:hypothetical protein [Candidatus Omnitrophota bacterium]MDD3988017.1 hypothetical protein [Candidatus Omnitrophota bacterium]MDD4982198.1 hypothetical protein [Candidatus Omnitrophota bacterium]MDD5665216.1 hypothetical protein [Candidatus Omnitrophota bacterium]
MVKIILPELGDGIKKATISYWYHKIGDNIAEKEDLIELTTDKATFNLPSPCKGILSEIAADEGTDVEVGAVLGSIRES